MSYRCAGRRWVVALVLTAGFASSTAAQQKTAASGHGAVDVVTLKSGRPLRGGIASRQPNGSLSMAVSLEWLRESNAKMAATALAENVERRRAAWTQTRDRITERLKAPINEPRLTFFFKQELERLNQCLADRTPADPEFLWVDVAHDNIGKVAQASPEQRKIALFAWNERLAKVETRDASSLMKELNDKGVKLDVTPPDLSERLPARPQDNTEWAARLALVEYAVVKPLDFQGMGDTLVRTGEGQAVNLAEVLPKLLEQQIGSLLKDLTNEGRPANKPANDTEWLKPAIREAEAAKLKGFRVTRLEVDAGNSRAVVETRFVAQTAPGKWQVVWRDSVTEDGSKARPEAEALIEQDPQVKSALGTLKSLGLVDAKVLQQATRMGAATMAAQQTADGSFAEFRDRYTRHLDGPPIMGLATSRE